jgi:hypothetical protein
MMLSDTTSGTWSDSEAIVWPYLRRYYIGVRRKISGRRISIQQYSALSDKDNKAIHHMIYRSNLASATSTLLSECYNVVRGFLINPAE